MSETQLFSVEIFQISTKSLHLSDDDNLVSNNEPLPGYKFIKSHPNMTSARVIKGKMIELEHSNLVGQSVKFKTVINFDRSLDTGTSLGVVLKPQEGYVTKPENY